MRVDKLLLLVTFLCSQESGDITYNGKKLNEFRVQRTSAYISQTDNHIAELTVRETFDFAARCQGASEGFAGLLILIKSNFSLDFGIYRKNYCIYPHSELTSLKHAFRILIELMALLNLGFDLREFCFLNCFFNQLINYLYTFSVFLFFASTGHFSLITLLNETMFSVVLSIFTYTGYLEDLTRLEKERNIRPSPEIDAFMKVVTSNFITM